MGRGLLEIIITICAVEHLIPIQKLDTEITYNWGHMLLNFQE